MHINNVEDSGFQKSVKPLVQQVLDNFTKENKGLDYGCGNGPVITHLLSKKGFDIALYDPFYNPNVSVLERHYDFIICNEVMEHFYHPQDEFKILYHLLKPNGKLICGTQLYTSDIDFDTWFYKNDPTHVFFYTEMCLNWICSNIGFKAVKRLGNCITFQK